MKQNKKTKRKIKKYKLRKKTTINVTIKFTHNSYQKFSMRNQIGKSLK